MFFDGNVSQSIPSWESTCGKVFLEPARLDLVLWLQGTGLQPFLEKGERTDRWKRGEES
jgi:hypothetical protein